MEISEKQLNTASNDVKKYYTDFIFRVRELLGAGVNNSNDFTVLSTKVDVVIKEIGEFLAADEHCGITLMEQIVFHHSLEILK